MNFFSVGSRQSHRSVCLGLWRGALILIPTFDSYSTEDDEYNGYLIPGGSVVLGNVWFVYP